MESISGPTNGKKGHSADVRMHLNVHGRSLRIGHLGPDFVILDDLADHPPGEAEIVMSVDGRVRRWMVDLPEGLCPKAPRTVIGNCRAI